MHWGIISYITGTSCYFHSEVRRKQEREAEEFAAFLLAPDEELNSLAAMETDKLAGYFGIPIEMMQFRLSLR